MNVAATIAISSAVLAVYAGLLTRRLSRAAGWGDQRWFSVVAFSSAAYAVGNLGTTLGAPDDLVVVLSRVQLASALVQTWAWMQYADGFTGRRAPRRVQLLVHGLLVLAALVTVPGLAMVGPPGHRPFEPFGIVYHDARTTPFGDLVMLLAVMGALAVLARFAHAWRSGVRHAGLLTCALSLLILLGVNDALASSLRLPLPYLLDVAFVIPVTTVAWTLTQRFIDDAAALQGLRGRLEALVEDRTRDLTRAQEALRQVERLASLGQFAAGVAHEVNNPASVVTANLRYLAEAARGGPLPPDAPQSVEESLEAMQRINALVRRMVDAGRLAAMPASAGMAEVLAVVEQAVAEARARTGEAVDYQVRLPPGEQVAVRAEVLHQIVGPLLLNAGEAVPPGRRGRVEIGATRAEDGRLRLAIRDDGAGMSAEVLRRAFEPFFSARGVGRGAGLGLTVARALAESHGGELQLESRCGQGTTAVLLLPEAATRPA
jgi:signal transduction histidine kinase